ncbi:MAG: hypothetical protein J0L99_14575 [Chitinophagales bacterium]|nr:hypothetical protein [Chitinophagales bacterium]
MKAELRSKKVFAAELGISTNTLYAIIREIGMPLSGKLLTPRDQNLILKHLGLPPLQDWQNSGDPDKPSST